MRSLSKEARVDRMETKTLLAPPLPKVRQSIPKSNVAVVAEEEFVSPAPRNSRSTPIPVPALASTYTPQLTTAVSSVNSASSTPVKNAVDAIVEQLHQHHISSPNPSNSDSKLY